MAAVYLAPTFGVGYQSFTSTTAGTPIVNAGGSISTFLAGTTTPASTWSSNSGLVSNGNVIALDSSGRPGSPTNVEIWQTAGVALKYIIKDVNGVQIGIAYDNVLGINDPSGQISPNTEWVTSALVPSFISSASFSVPGNQVALFPVGQRVKSTVTAGTAYSTVVTAVFGSSTVVTVVNNPSATPLDSGLSAFATGLFLASAPSISAIGVAYDASIAPPTSPVTIASPVQRLDRLATLATTAGTAPTYTLTPTQVLGAYATNAPMLVKFHQSTAVGATPTLNVSGLGGLALVQVNSAGTQVPAQVVAGLISEVVYDGTSLVILSPYVSGRYLRTTVFAASGTWTKGADVGTIVVKAVGGGGGANAFGTGEGGGGSGGFSQKTIVGPASTYAVAVGAGGSVAGGNGGDTTLGSTIVVAHGGTGNTGTTAGGVGGVAGVGDITLVGGGAGYGGSWSANIYFGPGGNSALGGGAPGMLGSATGTAGATNTGGGASGGTTTGAIGGSGLVIVDEYS
jgi:hypothetical protein